MNKMQLKSKKGSFKTESLDASLQQGVCSLPCLPPTPHLSAASPPSHKQTSKLRASCQLTNALPTLVFLPGHYQQPPDGLPFISCNTNNCLQLGRGVVVNLLPSQGRE